MMIFNLTDVSTETSAFSSANVTEDARLLLKIEVLYLLNLMCLFFPDLLYIIIIKVSSVSIQYFITFKQRN